VIEEQSVIEKSKPGNGAVYSRLKHENGETGLLVVMRGIFHTGGRRFPYIFLYFVSPAVVPPNPER
jgi:hypothetical protein